MLKRYAVIIITGICLASSALASVTSNVKNTIDELFRIVADKRFEKHDPQQRQALKKVINTIFDYSEMTKQTLGKHWNPLTQLERNQFTILFSSLLDNSYISKIESYNNEKVVYLKETIEGNYAEIKSKIISAKRDEYTLDYRLINENGKWMVYDIVIEGVSMVANYRTQFNRVISDNGYNGLVKKLQSKIEDLKTS
jgi:phospholipid transport system substrate-binding protein